MASHLKKFFNILLQNEHIDTHNWISLDREFNPYFQAFIEQKSG